MGQTVALLKESLRRSSPQLSKGKDPFFCINIVCPPDSYDPNIEPAKDDVMFDDAQIVLDAINKLFKANYPEAVLDVETELPASVQELDEDDGMRAMKAEEEPTSFQTDLPDMDE